MALLQAGLLQVSPLSPILFLFFNADLVQFVNNKNKGVIAFTNDYSAWVTGPLASENVAQLQEPGYIIRHPYDSTLMTIEKSWCAPGS